MKTEISYKKAMATIWDIKKNNMSEQFMKEYSNLNHKARAIIQCDTPTPIKKKKILELFIRFTLTHRIYFPFMRKLGFYKWKMEQYLTITPKL